LTASIAKRIEQLGLPAPERLAASVVSEMVGALALSRTVEDPAESEQILKSTREALKARLSIPTGHGAQLVKGA
jgi:TetR/AcrR family transcriptional repressor of nem operon